MNLVRDLLDTPVIDRHGREIGRADAILVEIRADGPPRVAAIEIGPAVLAYRLAPLFGRWVSALEHALGIAEGRPLRIPFADILDMRDRITVDRAAGETAAANLEHRLRRWVAKIPGAS